MENKKSKADLSKKKIWIDLDNSPHVPFFSPIIEELSKRGYQVTLTARDCFQVCGLADLFNMRYARIGRHYGKNKILKVAGTLIRSFQLLPTALKEKPALAVSHGSRSQLITAWCLRIPVLILFDYEYTQTLGFVAPNWQMGPEVIAHDNTGYHKKTFLSYPGIKEDVYVPTFNPNQACLDELGLKEDDFIVTIRPPATEAHYHNPESEKLFIAVVERLADHRDLRMVILPRNEKKQTAWIKNKWSRLCDEGKIIIPDHAVNGLDLIWFSDLVISGGGTMNREAAALNIPVYTIFRGKIGAVDRYLSEKGKLVLLTNLEDVKTKLRVKRRDKSQQFNKQSRPALETIVNQITSILERA